MPGLGRAIHVMGRKRNARRGWGGGAGEVSCQRLLSQVAPCYKCYRVSCVVTI